MKSTFVGWKDEKNNMHTDLEYAGKPLLPHQGDKAKEILGAKRLTPVFSRG